MVSLVNFLHPRHYNKMVSWKEKNRITRNDTCHAQQQETDQKTMARSSEHKLSHHKWCVLESWHKDDTTGIVER